MGQFKVPQDVEAEDKIIGSLTIKQFIYTCIGVVWGLLSFYLLRDVPLLFVSFGVLPSILFLALGLIKRGDIPFEQLFLAMVSFWVNSRRRIWYKEPIQKVFEVELPKPVEIEATVDRKQIHGQLEKLAQIVDTRGWSIKQSEVQEPEFAPTAIADDRLVAPEAIAPAPQPIDVHAADDILDAANNLQAQNISALIENHAKSIRDEALEKLKAHKLKAESQKSQSSAQAQISKHASGIISQENIQSILKPDYEDMSVATVAAQANRQITQGETVNLRGGSNG